MKHWIAAACVARLAVSCGCLLSCASVPVQTTVAPMEETAPVAEQDVCGDWMLVSYTKDGIAQTIAAATLSVANDGAGGYVISGFSGVNNYTGSLTTDGNAISVAPNLAATRMAGPPPAMEFEAMYMELLATADRWCVSDTELSIAGGAIVARFRKIGLDGSAWNLVGANTGNAVVSQDGNITLSFADGAATGFTGINTVRLGYTADETTRALSFADGPLTLRAGTEAEAKTERLFLDNLFQTASYALSGDHLTLYNADGTTLLHFVKAERGSALPAADKGRVIYAVEP